MLFSSVSPSGECSIYASMHSTQLTNLGNNGVTGQGRIMSTINPSMCGLCVFLVTFSGAQIVDAAKASGETVIINDRNRPRLTYFVNRRRYTATYIQSNINTLPCVRYVLSAKLVVVELNASRNDRLGRATWVDYAGSYPGDLQT